MVKRIDLWAVAVVLGLVMAFLLSGCRTVQGIGMDLQLASESLETYAASGN